MKLNVKPPKNWFSEPWVKHILSTQSAFGILLTLPLPPALTTIHFCNNLLLFRISVQSASYIFVAINLNCISHIVSLFPLVLPLKTRLYISCLEKNLSFESILKGSMMLWCRSHVTVVHLLLLLIYVLLFI